MFSFIRDILGRVFGGKHEKLSKRLQKKIMMKIIMAHDFVCCNRSQKSSAMSVRNVCAGVLIVSSVLLLKRWPSKSKSNPRKKKSGKDEKPPLMSENLNQCGYSRDSITPRTATSNQARNQQNIERSSIPGEIHLSYPYSSNASTSLPRENKKNLIPTELPEVTKVTESCTRPTLCAKLNQCGYSGDSNDALEKLLRGLLLQTRPETNKTLSVPSVPGATQYQSYPGSSNGSSSLPGENKNKLIPTKLPKVTEVAESFTRSTLSEKLPPSSIKPTISLVSSKSAIQGEKVEYRWVKEAASPTYLCPEAFKSSIDKDIVPGVLKKPLSKSTYKEYFQALLYAEDSYLEKWDGFEIKNVTLQLHEATIHLSKGRSNFLNDAQNVEKTFVAFEIDKIPERLPFLLSRDFIIVRPLMKNDKTFMGNIYRVVKSNLVLAEFGKDFHSQHDKSNTYDVSFSFNRVCLKRAHEAILDASDDLFRNFIFPNYIAGNKFHPVEPFVAQKEARALRQVLALRGAPPYLLEGPLSLSGYNQLSETGVFVVKAVIQICQASPSNRILLCAPTNKTCDMLMRGLRKEIPESDMFRANAAFRELDGVPRDILSSSLYETEKECFSCPSLEELCNFKVILSTFMSSFRLHNHGIMAGHFTHIFLVDASSATEPETLVPLAKFAKDTTAVVVTGAQGNCSHWIRSTIARKNGLMISYFERIRNSSLYENRDPGVITILGV